MMKNTTTPGVVGLTILVLAFSDVCLSADSIRIVMKGWPVGAIVLPDDVDKQTESAAQVLVEYVEKSTGAKLPVVRESEVRLTPQAVTIYVGRSKYVNKIHPKLDDMDDDGFVIHTVKPSHIIIAGPTAYGTEFGVYEFLERYVGIRWLMPGPEGDDIPSHTSIDIPVEQVRQEPAFFSRQLSGLHTGWQTKWARFNRVHGRINFHHYLLKVLPPEKYAKTHPDFFPMKNGKTRYLPTANDAHGWQPCFSSQGSVEEAVKNISRYFDEHPEMPSCSLGVNDSSGHCRCPECLKRLPAEPNFLGRADYSDLYYDWCNRVIDGVLKDHPDKWFGCLAYSEVASPPKNVKVHERLIPYMTYDRMKWIHPEVEAAGHAATESWQKVSPSIGWYDYVYGSPYCLPRVYFHQSRKYLQYGHAHGVKACYAEIYPNWGEGPKPYIFLKLWWDPNADVDALLKDWYERCVGPDAAPFLAEYYSIWERFWTKDILDSSWFSTRGQYLGFNNPGYLLNVEEGDIAKSRRLLNQCIAKCRNDKQRARAELLEKAFQYYEASALAYLADNRVTPIIASASQALQALQTSEQAILMAEKRRHLALEIYPKDPILMHPLAIDRYDALSGTSWGGSGMWEVMNWVAKGNNSVRRRIAKLANDSSSPFIREQASLMLAIVDDRITPASQNQSFEIGEGIRSSDWSYWVKPDSATKKRIGQMFRSSDRVHTGQYSLLCESMFRGGPVNTIAPLPPDKYCALAWVYVDIPEGAKQQGMCELAVTPRSKNGKHLPGFSTKIIPPARKWTLIVAGGVIEREIDGEEVANALMIPIVNGFQDGGKVYWDDVALYKIDD